MDSFYFPLTGDLTAVKAVFMGAAIVKNGALW